MNQLLRIATFVRCTPVVFMLTLPTLVLAGGQATIKTAGTATEPLRLSWRNDAVMRMNIPEQPGYILVRNSSAYAVTSMNGQTVVMDLSSMATMMAGIAQSYGITGGQAVNVFSIDPTGQKETVAGMEGEIYRVNWSDMNGDKRTDPAVLSANPSVVEMSNAFINFAATNAQAMGQPNADAISRMLLDRELGILRFGDQFRVMTISDEALPEAEFSLPAQPIKIPGMH